jgi:spore cortex formation protein SpoVR/YcgB (stage V sporulation)
MEKTDKDTAQKHWLLTEGLEGLLADKWEERAERLRTMAQEAKKAEARVKTKEKRVGEIERMVDTVFKMEEKEEMRVRNELHSMRDETETGRRHVILRKVEIAEALLQWKEEMEAEKRECEEEIAERKAFAKSLETPLENMAELLDSRWLYDVVGDEQK